MTLPPWILERVRLGDVPPEWAERVAAAIDSPEVQSALASLDRSDRDILARHPAAAVANALAKRRAPSPRLRRAAVWAAPAAIAAAVVLFAVVVAKRPPVGVSNDTSDSERVKGGPSLLIHRHRHGRAERLQDGDTARTGDRLQLSYVARGARYGVIVSIDGGGAVTRHWPADAAVAAPDLAPQAALPFSYELDDAPAYERFFFVTATTPFDVATAIGAARALADGPSAATAPLSVPAELSQLSVTLVKETVQ